MILPLRTLDLGNDFDAVAGRLVLMYMADPAEAVKGFAQRLRPGGIVAFQEADFTQYRSFVDAGLPAPMMHYEALVGGADTWAGYPYAVQGFTSFMPHGVERGRHPQAT